MKDNIKFVCGTIAGILIGGITVVGANEAVRALQNTEIKVSLNGQVQEFKDETTGERQYPLTYNNRTYLPLRNVAQLAGLKVDYDNITNTAKLLDNDMNSNIMTDEQIIECAKAYYKLKNNYLPENATIETKTEDEAAIHFYDMVDDHIATSSWYYINPSTGKGTDVLNNNVDISYSNIIKLIIGEPEETNYSKVNISGKIAEDQELAKIENNNGINYFILETNTSLTKKEEELIEIKGLENKKVIKSIFYMGSQVVSSSTLVLLCDDGLYFAKWREEDMFDSKGDPTIVNTIYAKKIEVKNKINDIEKTELFTGDIEKGYKNFVLVKYSDGTNEEIFVNNNRMAS